MEDELRRELKEIRDIVTNIRIEVAELKIKAGIWGLLAGTISNMILVIFQILLKK